VRKRLLIGVGTVLFVAMSIAVWIRSDLSGDRTALEIYKTQLRDQGERLTFDELEARRDDRGEESISRFLDVAARIPGSNVTVMNYERPGAARVAWAGTDPPLLPKQGTAPITWEEWHEQIDAASIVVAELRESLRDPALRWGLRGTNTLVPRGGDLVVTRQAAVWLANAVVADMHRGRSDAAFENLLSLLDVVGSGREELCQVWQSIRGAIGRLGLGITWQAIQYDRWTEAQLAQLQNGWAELDFVRSLETGLLGQRAMFLHMLAWVREQVREQSGRTKTDGTLGEQLYNRAFRLIWRPDREEKFYLEHVQILLDGVRAVSGGERWPVVRVRFEEYEARLDRLARSIARFRHANGLIALSNLTRGIEQSIQTETERRMTVVALALKRYELRHGRPPTSLDALVPEFLSDVPRDPMSAQPLRYQVAPDGSYTLYSTGGNGVDDGGDPTPVNPDDEPGLWTGRDAVWPAPAWGGTR
jgi:hypothetical protein